jgi:hypothetical protein
MVRTVEIEILELAGEIQLPDPLEPERALLL